MLGGTVVFVKRPDSWALNGGDDWKLNNAAGNVVVLVARLPGLLWIDPVLEFRVWDRGIGKLDVGSSGRLTTHRDVPTDRDG